ncbi:lysyl-tRNA synthetase class I [Humibacillus xanthopallidus]|uniref:Lysine--tRNA ligase n=1 Tax=Humibacillus xanthopallidus TaxID=412689 RepID=A0A543PQ33_9MICO|nr:lysine--tRNA ligase [Humibacillus xanthopallidus]TQN46186.1 lysyl-tRNA synthetase class I [Humibacillus xanthopallidus]
MTDNVVEQKVELDWVTRLADEVVAEAQHRGVDAPIVCASGISPSGPIHLGNFRELITPHLVADEIKRRGIDCDHILSWDDFDRFRRVPKNLAGVDDSWEQYIGMPLTSVPPPAGSPHASWADHFKAPLLEAMEATGIEVRQISQTEQYRAGVYRDQVLLAMRERFAIDKVLDQYRTLEAAENARQKATGKGKGAGAGGKGPKLTEEQAAAATEAERGSGAASEDDGSEGKAGYYPFKPFCTACGTDFTTVTAYDDDSHELTYDCTRCGHSETVDLDTFTNGKLVWKVDWPMRWAHEHVMFEPSGVDHQSPGSSFVVGKDLAPIFGWERPVGPMYAFVGIAGMAKMSSSKGGVPIPTDALEVMEAPVLRWLYARRRPNQSFDVAFGPELQRLYDEWDALNRKVADGSAQPGDLAAHLRATSTASGLLPATPRPMPFRTIASVIDVTQGDEEQAVRILSELEPDNPVGSTDDLRPRLDCAERWMLGYVPAQDRTIVRTKPDAELLGSLDEQQRESLRLLADGLDEHWSLDGLTHLVYGVPKIQRGIDPEAKVKDPELSAAQRTFFVLVYRLLVSRDTGPRLPTLLLAVGADRVRTLIGH